jgi:hypothetical protein
VLSPRRPAQSPANFASRKNADRKASKKTACHKPSGGHLEKVAPLLGELLRCHNTGSLRLLAAERQRLVKDTRDSAKERRGDSYFRPTDPIKGLAKGLCLTLPIQLLLFRHCFRRTKEGGKFSPSEFRIFRWKLSAAAGEANGIVA